MITEVSPVIVSTNGYPSQPGIHVVRVRHRTLPVVCGEGATPAEAAEDLVRKLTLESSSVTGRQLSDLEQIIADVEALLD